MIPEKSRGGRDVGACISSCTGTSRLMTFIRATYHNGLSRWWRQHISRVMSSFQRRPLHMVLWELQFLRGPLLSHSLKGCAVYSIRAIFRGRTDSRFVPRQRETALLCNDVSQWLGAHLESALQGYCRRFISRFLPIAEVMAMLGLSSWLSTSVDISLSSHLHTYTVVHTITGTKKDYLVNNWYLSSSCQGLV